jgi:fumarylpyruvate hydrolase
MSNFVFPPALQASVAIAGSDARFPIRRVFCVGRNYEAHAREMGNDPNREPPFFFMKPADAVVAATGTVPYPPLTDDLHHEVEMVVAICKGGANLSADEALEHVWGYAVGVDLTRRDLQAVAKKMSRPWDWAKGFDASAPCGPIVPVAATRHPRSGSVSLSVNGEPRQQGDLNELIWPVADVIAYISQSVALAPGDIIFTGTPAGVGALQPGDRVSATVTGVGTIEFTMGPRPS